MKTGISKDTVEYLEKISESPLIWSEELLNLPFSEDPFVANHIQIRILSSKKRRIVACISRRAGKTFAAIFKALHLCFHNAGAEVLFIAPGEAQLEKFFSDLDDVVSSNALLVRDKDRSRKSPFIYTFKNKSKIKGFIAANGSKTLRGQSADLVIIDEADFIDSAEWGVIEPIITGDRYREPPEMFAVSTPNVDPKSRFQQLLGSEDENIEVVYVPIDQNPDYTPEEVEEIRKSYMPDRLADFQREYLCLPVGVSDRLVFKKAQIETAATLPSPPNANSNGYLNKDQLVKRTHHMEYRVLAVDWDRIQAGPSLMVISYSEGLPYYKVIYREEIDKNREFLFNYTCRRIIDMYKDGVYDYLAAEATRDVHQYETIQMIASKECPSLLKNMKAIDFNENIITIDRKTKEQIKKRTKTVIIGNLQTLFEEGKVRFPSKDVDLNRQLSMYKIIGITDRGPRYSNKDEHFIDCLSMGCWILHERFEDTIKIPPANSFTFVEKKEDPKEKKFIGARRWVNENPNRNEIFGEGSRHRSNVFKRTNF